MRDSRPPSPPRRHRSGHLVAGTKLDVRSRLVVLLEPCLVLAMVATLAWLRSSPPPRLLEQAKTVGTRSVELTWKANVPSHGFVEYFTHPDRKRRTRPDRFARTHFRQELVDLRPDTKYFFRYGFSPYETGEAARFSAVYEVKTRPDIKIRDIQVVDRKLDQVTIRWSTNLETDTKVRIGQTRDYTRIAENPEQRRELDHSIVIHGLKPNTTYHYQLVAGDPDDPHSERVSDDKRFVTRAESSSHQRRRPYRSCFAPRYPRHFVPPTPKPDLTRANKKRLASSRATAENFHDRRMFLDYWVTEFEEAERLLPPGITKPGWTVREEIEYLKSLYYVNERRALSKLDRCMRAMFRAEAAP